MSISERDYRDVMGRFATGVTVVTGLDAGGAPVGVTVNSFSSVSLAPPLVLFSLDRAADSLAPLSGASHFSVNVLSENQIELSNNFARDQDDKFAGVPWAPCRNGCPLLDGVLAVIECAAEATHDGGDHVIFIGRVERAVTFDHARPLLYYQGAYARIDGDG